MGQEAKKAFIVNIVFIFLTVIAIWLSFKIILRYLLPFFIAAAAAYFVQRPAEYISNRLKVKTGLCAVLITLAFYIAAIAVSGFIIWQTVIEAFGLLSFLPQQLTAIAGIFEDVNSRLLKFTENLPPSIFTALNTAMENTAEELIGTVTSFLSKAAADFASMLPSLLFFTVITVTASCYIAGDFKKLVKFFKSILKPSAIQSIALIKEVFTENIFRMLAGYLELAAITFFEIAAGLFILKVKYALAIAAVTAVIDLLPVFGSGTVLIPWSVFCFLSGDLRLGTGLIVIYICLVAVRNFLEPKIIGKNVGVSPLVTLFALFTGFKAGGAEGMILFPFLLTVVINYYRKQIEAEKSACNNS